MQYSRKTTFGLLAGIALLTGCSSTKPVDASWDDPATLEGLTMTDAYRALVYLHPPTEEVVCPDRPTETCALNEVWIDAGPPEIVEGHVRVPAKDRSWRAAATRRMKFGSRHRTVTDGSDVAQRAGVATDGDHVIVPMLAVDKIELRRRTKNSTTTVVLATVGGALGGALMLGAGGYFLGALGEGAAAVDFDAETSCGDCAASTAKGAAVAGAVLGGLTAGLIAGLAGNTKKPEIYRFGDTGAIVASPAGLSLRVGIGR